MDDTIPFLSIIIGSSTAIVAIVGGFITNHFISLLEFRENLAREKRSLEKKLRSFDKSLPRAEERRIDMTNDALQAFRRGEISELQMEGRCNEALRILQSEETKKQDCVERIEEIGWELRSGLDWRIMISTVPLGTFAIFGIIIPLIFLIFGPQYISLEWQIYFGGSFVSCLLFAALVTYWLARSLYPD
jgi:hypothetical protein